MFLDVGMFIGRIYTSYAPRSSSVFIWTMSEIMRYIQTVSEYHAGRCAKWLEWPILRHRRAWVLSGQRPYTQ